MENSFSVSELTKKYGRKTVLDKIGFDIPYGNIVGILGLNGAGKSTLFNVIAGFIGYQGKIDKLNTGDISYMPTDNLLFNDKTVKGMVNFYRDFVPDFDYRQALSDFTVLHINVKKLISQLSAGQKRIISFVLAVNCKAKVYLFDEPLTNLDIIYRDFLINRLITSINGSKLYLISSHELLELEPIFSHIMIISGNKLSQLYDVDEIRDEGKSVSQFYKEAVVC